MTPILGCVADDFTGATDLAGVLAANGISASVILNREPGSTPDSGAVIVALKTRTVPAQIACQQAIDSLKWLQQIGCSRFYFKYCSTFDSRASGNIGHVIDAMMRHLGINFTIACPAFPANGRTVYQANLFVHGQPLDETSMRHHPLTPMTDSNLVRVLQPQTTHKVGKLPYQVVACGADAIRAGCHRARKDGIGILVLDAIFEEDLRQIALACDHLTLLTGASGLALGFPAGLESIGLLTPGSGPKLTPHIDGYEAILSGSCSSATRRQVAAASRHMPTFQLDPVKALSQPDMAEQISTWARTRLPNGPVLVSATADAQAVACAQEKLGVEQTGQLIERVLADSAIRLVAEGVRKLIVAGGETSGAVVGELGIGGLYVGPEIDPGVNWMITCDERPIALALKSGNFGSDDFFLKAWTLLP